MKLKLVLFCVLLPTLVCAQGPINAGCVGTDANGNIKAGCTGISNIQISTGTTSVPALSCLAETSVTMTGLLTTSVIDPPTSTTDPTTVSGWGPGGTLYISFRIVSANTLGWRQCNSSATASIAAGSSITWNVGAR